MRRSIHQAVDIEHRHGPSVLSAFSVIFGLKDRTAQRRRCVVESFRTGSRSCRAEPSRQDGRRRRSPPHDCEGVRSSTRDFLENIHRNSKGLMIIIIQAKYTFPANSNQYRFNEEFISNQKLLTLHSIASFDLQLSVAPRPLWLGLSEERKLAKFLMRCAQDRRPCVTTMLTR